MDWWWSFHIVLELVRHCFRDSKSMLNVEFSHVNLFIKLCGTHSCLYLGHPPDWPVHIALTCYATPIASSDIQVYLLCPLIPPAIVCTTNCSSSSSLFPIPARHLFIGSHARLVCIQPTDRSLIHHAVFCLSLCRPLAAHWFTLVPYHVSCFCLPAFMCSRNQVVAIDVYPCDTWHMRFWPLPGLIETPHASFRVKTA